MISRALLERVINGKRDERMYLCEQEFALFAMYYFSDYFTYKLADFHWGMFSDLNNLTRHAFTFLLWIMFRESAKTTIAKIYVVYCIAYRKKRFINYDSYDKGNAEAALFDITVWLQTNKRLIADFGPLFNEDKKASQSEKTMKRVNEFVTTNKVKVKAYSTQESTRGRIFLKYRPDLYIIDDFETETTIQSAAITAKIVRHIDALKSGLSADGQVISLCNYISESGSVASLLQEAKENPRSWHTRKVDVVDEEGTIAWPDKYVATDDEAAVANAMITDPRFFKVSLEKKKRDLNANGRKVYEAEMLNNPEAADVPFFDRAMIDAAEKAIKGRQPVKRIGEFALYEPYTATNMYVIGGDTAKGVGRDSCASAALRLGTELKPAAFIGSFSSNTIAPDMFGTELKQQGEALGECLLAPELNNTGYATVTQLKLLKYPHIYRQIVEDQMGKVVKDDLGWEATSVNVSDIYYKFRTAFNEGHLQILDPALLAEMRPFTRRHLEESVRRTVSVEQMATKHFDLLRAACIAFAVRYSAKKSKEARKAYKQPDVAPRSEYQG